VAIEKALKTFVLADSAVAALIGTRFVPAAEAQTLARPYVRYTLVAEEKVRAQRRNSGLRWAVFQLDAFGDSYAAAKESARAVEARLDPTERTRRTFGDTCVTCCTVRDTFDEYEEPEKGGEKGVYRTTLEVKLWYEG
jgi:hypothetical protein